MAGYSYVMKRKRDFAFVTEVVLSLFELACGPMQSFIITIHLDVAPVLLDDAQTSFDGSRGR